MLNMRLFIFTLRRWGSVEGWGSWGVHQQLHGQLGQLRGQCGPEQPPHATFAGLPRLLLASRWSAGAWPAFIAGWRAKAHGVIQISKLIRTSLASPRCRSFKLIRTKFSRIWRISEAEESLLKTAALVEDSKNVDQPQIGCNKRGVI